MPAASPLKNPVKVSLLLRRRLRELKRTPRELAEAVKVSEDYMADLVAGSRRPAARARGGGEGLRGLAGGPGGGSAPPPGAEPGRPVHADDQIFAVAPQR